MNRYAVMVNKDELDCVLKGLRVLDCHVSSVSCTSHRYMIIYRSDVEYQVDFLKTKGSDTYGKAKCTG